MKLQVITTVAVISGFFANASADAGKFNLGNAIRTAQTINRTVNNVQKPKYTTLPYNPPKTTHPAPIVQPLPHPGYQPPVCKKPYQPVPQPGHCQKPPCPPVNRPPAKCYTMKLINGAGAEVYYNLDKSNQYTTMPTGDVDIVKSHTPNRHHISYHNGQEVVEYELDPTATYSFEWQGQTLMLLEIQG